MSNELIVIEHQLRTMAPHFAEALDNRMPVERLIRTVVISCERTPKLLGCTPQSILQAAMSAAVLGLEVDGVTGQAFLLPFAGRAQLVIGYKGYNTLGARSGLTITGKTVREGDRFDYALGTKAFVEHVPKLGNTGRIIGAWAQAEALDRPPIVEVLGIDDIMAVKEKAPGGSKPDSPWNEPRIGFPAMAEKTVKRRLARSLPLNAMQLAARMEEAVEEQGKPAFIRPDRTLVINGEVSSPIAPREAVPTPTAGQLLGPAEDPLLDDARAKADEGRDELNEWFDGLKPVDKDRVRAIRGDLERRLDAARKRREPAY